MIDDVFVAYKSNVFLLKSLMNTILTPESICELDTFSLQEQIEELDRHPQKELYAHIIQMAKLELIDRLEIQEFGRQLANDQYKLDLDFNLPSIKPTIKVPSKLPSVRYRKDFAAQLQLNMAAVGSFVTVGKPAVSNHIKPKRKQAQFIQKPKSFLKAKKYSYSKPKPKTIVTIQKQAISNLKEDGLIKRKVEHKSNEAVLESKGILKQQQPQKQQFSLKDKLKKEVQEMKVVYRQNDAYDDMQVIKMSPLNLKEEEEKIMKEQKQQISVEQTRQEIKEHLNNETREQQKSSIFFNEKQKNRKIQEQTILKFEESAQENKKQQKQQQKPAINLIPKQTISQSAAHQHQQEEEQPPAHAFLAQFAASTSNSMQTSNLLTSHTQTKTSPQKQSFCSARQQQKLNNDSKYTQAKTVLDNFDLIKQSTNREMKSKSVKNFNKKIIHNLNRDTEHCQLLPTKFKQTLIRKTYAGEEEGESEARLKADIARLRKSGAQPNLKPVFFIKPQSNYFPYNQIIPSFQKLFPHTKNLLVTLRNIEENLRLHFDKNVNQKSRNNEFTKITSEDLTFRIISESEKAKKNSHLFFIELESFHNRGIAMLSRLRNELDEVSPQQMLLYRVVRTKEEVYDIINSSFHRTNNWFELPHGLQLKMSWNLLWTWSKPQIDFSDLFYFQKVNHFIGNKQIARKDLLKKNIQKIQKLGNKIKQVFDIIPQTFLLPGENIPFIKKFRENGLKDALNFWILKPVGLSRGRGISLINKLQDVVFSEPIVLQRYISNPLLIDGVKFDMRIYVLVTSMNPLQAFLYKEGFARLSTEKYSLNEESMENKFIHLTNFSVQRQHLSDDKKHTFQEEIGGCKISLKMLSNKLKGMNIDWEAISKQIQDIILKSLIACMNVIPQNPNCFELFGYDIFIDTNLKCWLLEVNSSPSLEKQFTLDQIIKQQLVDDIIQIVNPVNYDRQKLLQVIERRRREAEGLKSSINTTNNSVQQLNQDLNYILNGSKLRKYGENINTDNFKMIAPSDNYHKIIKILQQYKIDPIEKNQI